MQDDQTGTAHRAVKLAPNVGDANAPSKRRAMKKIGTD